MSLVRILTQQGHQYVHGGIYITQLGSCSSCSQEKSQWCLTLTPNSTETIKRMTCHCFLWPVRRDLTSCSYSTVSLYPTLSIPTGESTLNSQIFVFPILALLIFKNSICFIRTGKLTCLYYSSQLDTACLEDSKGSTLLLDTIIKQTLRTQTMITKQNDKIYNLMHKIFLFTIPFILHTPITNE